MPPPSATMASAVGTSSMAMGGKRRSRLYLSASETNGVASSHSTASASTTMVFPKRQSRHASHRPISASKIGPAGGSARAVSSFSAYSMAVIMAERLAGWLVGWLVRWFVGCCGGGSGADDWPPIAAGARSHRNQDLRLRGKLPHLSVGRGARVMAETLYGC